MALLYLGLAPAAGLADCLFFVASDHHSQYANAPLYIRATSQLRQAFLLAHPDGCVGDDANGDVAGPSAYTYEGSDDGWLALRLFALLARDGRQLFLNFGNHEQVDLVGDYGHRMVLDQYGRLFREMQQVTGKPFRITTANVVPGMDGKDLFEPYRDAPGPGGKTIRKVGLLLDGYFGVSIYDRTAPTQLILDVAPMVEVLKQEIARAAEAGVDALVPEFHEEIDVVRPAMEEVLRWKAAQGGRIAALKIPYAAAAHDHKFPPPEKVGDTWLVDSGTAYAFSAIALDDDLDVRSIRYYGVGAPPTLAALEAKLPPAQVAALRQVGWDAEPLSAFAGVPDSALTEAEREAARLIQEQVDHVNRQHARVIGHTRAFDHTRAQLKEGRYELGDRVCDAMAEWGQDVMVQIRQGLVARSTSRWRSWLDRFARRADRFLGRVVPPRFRRRNWVPAARIDAGTRILGSVALFNSGSIRVDQPIPEGDFTYGQAFGIYPFPGRPGMFVLTGARIQEIYTEIREHVAKRGHGEFSPQLSSNLKVDAGGQLLFSSDGASWAPLQPRGQYVLAMDPAMTRNDYLLTSIAAALQEWPQSLVPDKRRANEILPLYIPRHFGIPVAAPATARPEDPAECAAWLHGAPADDDGGGNGAERD